MPHFKTRRIVTGHNPDGLAIVREDRVLPSYDYIPGFVAVNIWHSNEMPVNNNGDMYTGGSDSSGKGAGTHIELGEMAGNSECAIIMHRTETLDYAVILSGRCDMHLDSGEVVHLSAGDIVVQRGTNHAWSNPYPEVVKFLFVLVDAHPVKVGDKLLGDLLSELPGGVLRPTDAS